jgi:aldehyde reductase
MTPKVPSVKLNNGREMPIFGLGTWQAFPGEVTEAVKNAIDAGYRHIDCAMLYANEPEIGAAIKAKIDEGIVKREDLFITSKLWCNFHSKSLVVPTLKQTLKDLGLDYLDMYLVHWPMGFKEGGELMPWLPDGTIAPSDVDYLETWEGMEEALELGLTKSIGVSNFNSEQLDRLLKVAKVVPANNQFEVSPYLNNLKLVELCQSKGIAVTGYSPFGGAPTRPGAKPDDLRVLEDEVLKQLGQKHNKSSAQIILRWAIQHNIIMIPKSVNKKRLEDNISIFDFTLSSDEMKQIDELDRNYRTATMEFCKTHKFYPFNIEY